MSKSSFDVSYDILSGYPYSMEERYTPEDWDKRATTALAGINRRNSQRLSLLDPNDGVVHRLVKGCVFSAPPLPLALGVPVERLYVSTQPNYDILPKRLAINVPIPGMIILKTLIVGNVTVVDGPVDAYLYSSNREDLCDTRCRHCGAPRSIDQQLHCRYCRTVYPVVDTLSEADPGRAIDCQLIRPSIRAAWELSYNGRCPPSYSVGDPFDLSIVLIGDRVER